MANLTLVVLGDSIQWGQGLVERDKISGLVATALMSTTRDVQAVRFAHSGAEVWDANHSGWLDLLDPTPPPLPPAPADLTLEQMRAAVSRPAATAAERDATGEVPTSTPFSLAQIVAASDSLSAKADVVLVNGGINDVRVPNIIFPQKNVDSLLARTESFRGYMKKVLDTIGTCFPDAKIVVTGYYPIVSEQTDFARLLAFHHALVSQTPLGAQVWPAFGFDGFEDAVADAMTGIASVAGLAAARRDLLGAVGTVEQHLTRLSKVFCDTIHEVLAADIDAFNGAGAQRAQLAIPAFAPENAIYAPESYLWAVDSLLAPGDEVVAQRRRECACTSPVEKFVCDRASTGHPNQAGALAYKAAVLDALSQLGVS
jgi:hypothetical protein